MRKIYLLPNLVTTGNLFCGFYSLLASFRGDFQSAAWMIMLAGVFDMLDGRIARLARATSAFGIQYDSLSDLISFGVAPAVLIYQWQLSTFDRAGLIAAFLFLVGGAFRLARFNVNSEVLPKGYFQGLPIPMAAGMIATFAIFSDSYLGALRVSLPTLVFGLGVLMACLMVSTIPFPSFKELNWRSRASFGFLLIGVMVLVFVAIRPELTLFLTGSTYVVTSLLWNLVRLVRGKSVESKSAGAEKL